MNRPFRRLLVITVLATTLTGAAQAPITPNTEMRMLETSNDVAAYVDAAHSEILLSAYMLRVQRVAESLRRAIVERGVPVYILTTEGGLQENASYAKSLALAGAHVRSSHANADLLIVDRYYSVNGPLIGALISPDGMEPTFALTGQDYANSLVALYLEQFNASTPYDPRELHQ